MFAQHSSAVPADPVSAEGGGSEGGGAGLEGDGEDQCVSRGLRLRAAALHSRRRSDQSPLHRLVNPGVKSNDSVKSIIVNLANVSVFFCLSGPAAQRASLWQ